MPDDDPPAAAGTKRPVPSSVGAHEPAAEPPDPMPIACGQRRRGHSRPRPAPDAGDGRSVAGLFQLPPDADPRLAALTPDLQEAFARASKEVLDEFLLLGDWDAWETWQAIHHPIDQEPTLPLSEEERSLIRWALRDNPPWLHGPAEPDAAPAAGEPSIGGPG